MTHRASGRTAHIEASVSDALEVFNHPFAYTSSAVMQFTPANMTASVNTVLAGWLMLRAGAAKQMLKIRSRERCAACGRRLEHGRCPCTRS